MSSELRLSALAAGILIDEPEQPSPNIFPRKKSDDHENGGHNNTVRDDLGSDRRRRVKDPEQGTREDESQHGKPKEPMELPGALVANRRDSRSRQRGPQVQSREQQ